MYYRLSFKNILNDNQLCILEDYFSRISKLPIRKEKIKLANDLKIDPVILNKWFQARRNKEKRNNNNFRVELELKNGNTQ